MRIIQAIVSIFVSGWKYFWTLVLGTGFGILLMSLIFIGPFVVHAYTTPTTTFFYVIFISFPLFGYLMKK